MPPGAVHAQHRAGSPLFAGNPVGNTIQGWQGYAVTTVCTDGRNKMFPSLLFLDRHVA